MSRVKAINDLDARNYQRNVLHTDACAWIEKNCYIDVWIEVIHALNLEARAILPFAAFVDFEGDQWTFFKPPHEELWDLYGIEVHELYVWRPLIEHAKEHLGSGKLISTEADAFWLPDTSGTDYRRQHTKSTIVLNDVDVDNARLGYFHNASYYSLEGEDFAQLFRLAAPHDPAYLPLFAEVIRVDRVVRHTTSRLVELSRDLWFRHLARRPAANPVSKFRERLEGDLPGIQEHGLAYYHAWAFGTIRQLGAASELAARNLEWLIGNGMTELQPAVQAFEQLSASSKILILKGARAAVAPGRKLGAESILEEMSKAWAAAMTSLESTL